MAGIWLSMLEYMDYVNGNENSRCVHEGEEVVNAGHIILYGKTEHTRNHIKLIALCLQSSAIYADPHEILGTLAIEPNNKVKIVNMSCTCKAGLGGACKHISGALIQCTRCIPY
ncbi:hypothetical protein JTB14_019275 [Gonioctena quinquepunctata]|nr:hypothetical protein JTB14_019275 [Gonioctena quinquepunctata]